MLPLITAFIALLSYQAFSLLSINICKLGLSELITLPALTVHKRTKTYPQISPQLNILIGILDTLVQINFFLKCTCDFVNIFQTTKNITENSNCSADTEKN